MALFQVQAPKAGNRSEGREDRPQAQLWLNVGITVDVPQEDGSMKPTFLSLPVGIPLDTTEPMAIRGDNPVWAQQVQVKNALLAFCQDTASKLEPGEGELMENLQVQVYRRKVASEAPNAGANPLLAQLAAAGIKIA